MSRYVLMCLKPEGVLNEGEQTNLDVGYIMLDIIPIFFVSAMSLRLRLRVLSFSHLFLLRASRRA